MPDPHDIGGDSDVLVESETKLEKPKLFKVLLHNDDFTTMEFVIWVLEYVFQKPQPEAFAIMLKVHNEGVGIAGIYPYDIAYMKSQKAMNLAKAREYPLLSTVEEE
jgi:ATP-dependent Clp protease adaptor protein ClpS